MEAKNSSLVNSSLTNVYQQYSPCPVYFQPSGSIHFYIPFILFCGITVALNAIIVFTFFRNRDLRKHNNNIFILSMCFADLLVGIVALCTSIYLLASPHVIFSTERLYFLIPLVACINISGFTLILMTIDRMISVKSPLRYKMLVTEKVLGISISTTWIVPCILCAISIPFCKNESPLFLYLSFITTIWIVSLTLGISNIYLYVISNKMSRCKPCNNNNDNDDNKNYFNNNKDTKFKQLYKIPSSIIFVNGKDSLNKSQDKVSSPNDTSTRRHSGVVDPIFSPDNTVLPTSSRILMNDLTKKQYLITGNRNTARKRSLSSVGSGKSSVNELPTLSEQLEMKEKTKPNCSCDGKNSSTSNEIDELPNLHEEEPENWTVPVVEKLRGFSTTSISSIQHFWKNSTISLNTPRGASLSSNITIENSELPPLTDQYEVKSTAVRSCRRVSTTSFASIQQPVTNLQTRRRSLGPVFPAIIPLKYNNVHPLRRPSESSTVDCHGEFRKYSTSSIQQLWKQTTTMLSNKKSVTCLIYTVIYMCCMLPVTVHLTGVMLKRWCPTLKGFQLFASLTLCNSLFNPLMYFFKRRNLRNSLNKLLRRKFKMTRVI